MKFPENKYIASQKHEEIEGVWDNAALQIGLETGVFVEVGVEYSPPNPLDPFSYSVPVRIYFRLSGHEFESLTDLKKALSNKAFL
jgi:hypothetical protein